jgi:hypothetical protein
MEMISRRNGSFVDGIVGSVRDGAGACPLGSRAGPGLAVAAAELRPGRRLPAKAAARGGDRRNGVRPCTGNGFEVGPTFADPHPQRLLHFIAAGGQMATCPRINDRSAGIFTLAANPAHQRRGIHGAGLARDFAAVPEQCQGRDRADAEARRELLFVLGIDFRQAELRFQLFRRLGEGRRHGRQGPHQGAQKSTSRGMSERATWVSKFAAPSSRARRKQARLALAAGAAVGRRSAGMRLAASQWGQTTIRGPDMLFSIYQIFTDIWPAPAISSPRQLGAECLGARRRSGIGSAASGQPARWVDTRSRRAASSPAARSRTGM